MNDKKITLFLLNESFFYELKNDSGTRVIYKDKVYKNRIKSFLFKACFSLSVNSLFPMPLKRFWFRSLFRKAYHPDSKNIFIFYEWWYDSDFMQWLKRKHKDVTTVLYLDDTVGMFRKTVRRASMDKVRKEFDFIFSYDADDVKQYGFRYTSAFFSKYEQKDLPDAPKSDICFIGLAKDRGEFITRIFNRLNGSCDCNFVICSNRKDLHFPDGIRVLDKTMPYTEYLANEVNSNCILEILKEDTVSPTFRCWEAVYYNKKLLTNWKGIKGFSYYDPRFMRYFEDENDIDVGFISDKTKPDYQYRNENSPSAFISKVKSLVEP